MTCEVCGLEVSERTGFHAFTQREPTVAFRVFCPEHDPAKARWRERAQQEATTMAAILTGDEGVPAPPTQDDDEPG